MNLSSDSDSFDEYLPHQAGIQPHVLRRLRLRLSCIIGVSLAGPGAVAQAPMVFDNQLASVSVSNSSAYAETAAEPPRNSTASDGRPSFLPAPAPREATARRTNSSYGYAEQPDRQAAPETMITQVEIPVPPPTAEPLTFPDNTPSSSYSDNAYYDQSQSRPQSEYRQAATPAPAVAPAARMRAAPRTVENRYGEVIPIQEITSASTITSAPTASTPIPEEAVSPTIIYDKGQQAIPQPPTPEAPPPPPNFGLLIKQKRYAEVEAAALENSDSKLASALGWARYRDGQNNLAYHWFERAIQWNDGNHEASYGMALTLYRMGRYDQAEEIARWRAAQYPKMNKVLGDITARRAVSSFQSKQYRESRETLASIKRHRTLSREEQIMFAWSDFNLGNLAAARAEFVRLYREKPDRFAADGVYTVYAKDRDWSGLEDLVRKHRGPLEALYQQYVSQKYYDYGLYREAYTQDPCARPELQNISSSAAAVQVIGRTRSGTEGTSQLSEYGARATGTFYVKDVNRFDVTVGVSNLDSGHLDRNTAIGQVPKDGDKRNFKFAPKTQYDGLIDARVRWEHEGLLTPVVEVGITPVNGAIDPTFVGAAGLKRVYDTGNWTAEVYRDPVKDSLLSYTGLRDPFTGRRWGRVTETGGRFSFYKQTENDFGFYGAASAGVIAGHNVPNNSHAALTLAASKDLRMKGFDYFAVGPSLSLAFYDKNLSQFTFGQGGYFSPSHLIQGVIGARFLTHQGGSSLVRGNAGLGIQTNKQDGTPFFPNKPDGRWHGSTSSSGAAINLDVEGLYMLSDQWVIGGQLALNVAPDYNDFSVRLSLQYFFERRGGLFVQDFLTF